ncbi:hypothetical protein [Streptomyces sp. NPDC058613]
MNDTFSLIADLLTIAGTLLSLTLQTRRARKDEAGKEQNGEEQNGEERES